jgi:hypothetical protein
MLVIDQKTFNKEYNNYQNQLIILGNKYNFRNDVELAIYQTKRKELTKVFVERCLIMSINEGKGD